MSFHVVYRTWPGDNDKERPGWYDRRTAWDSMVASLAGVPGSRVTVVADGGLPAELVGVVGRVADVVVVRAGGTARSLRRAVTVGRGLAAAGGPDTVFRFAEDDYLYRPEALPAVVAAAAAVRAADYLSVWPRTTRRGTPPTRANPTGPSRP